MRARIGALTTLIFFGCGLRAENLTDHYLRALAQAKNAGSVSEIRSRYEKLRVLRTACAIEIREKQIPIDCYEAAHLEGQIHPDSAKLKSRLKRLNRLCARAAESHPDMARPSGFLSEDCARALKTARTIQSYREQDSEALNGTDDWPEP